MTFRRGRRRIPGGVRCRGSGRWPPVRLHGVVETSGGAGSLLKHVLDDGAALDDDLQRGVWVGEQLDVFEWITVDEEDVGDCANLDPPQRSGVEVAAVRTAGAVRRWSTSRSPASRRA